MLLKEETDAAILAHNCQAPAPRGKNVISASLKPSR